jgi:hypothetical protein
MWIFRELARAGFKMCGCGRAIAQQTQARRSIMSGVFRVLSVAVLLGCLASVAWAPDASKSQSAAPAAPSTRAATVPTANPADVSSVDAIMAATYDVISGPPTKKRDWDRFRSLFVPGARLIPADRGKDGTFKVDVITPDEYAKMADPYFSKNGFAEREIFRKSERYGNIMQIFSTYESRHDAGDAKPFARGINSFQLLYDGKRWWVVTIYWQEEDADNPLPKEFLPAAK